MLNFLKNNKRLIPPFVTLLAYLLIGFFIYSTLVLQNNVSVSQVEKEELKKESETHPASVTLIVDPGNNQISYYARLTDRDRLTSLLEYHFENSGITFSKLEYTYGIELDNVNGIKAPEGYEWKVYDNDEEITYTIGERFLQDEHTYTIRLEPKDSN